MHAGRLPLIDRVSWSVDRGGIAALVGPSGVGKSTLLRCLNRMTDLTPGLRVAGGILLNGLDVRAPGTDPDRLRERVGMVFQQPVIFPGSVRDNVVFGVRRLRRLSRRQLEEVAERALREAELWDQVRDRLRSPAHVLSVGQQQRLCLARAVAGDPGVLLMDEPTSALDPQSTAAIEQWMLAQKGRRTVVLVTHAIAQARRVADRVGVMLPGDRGGRIAFDGPSRALFAAAGTEPVPDQVRAYIGHT